MALSDYLTGAEWDACFYASIGQHHCQCQSFGESMHKTIDALLEAGHQFPGLDSSGQKYEQVCNGVNAPKVLMMFGMNKGIDILEILENGRRFLKDKLPALVDETDEEWAQQMIDARSKAAEEKGATA